MWLTIVHRENKQTYAIVAAYAPQLGCPEAMKLEVQNSLEDCVNDLARDTIVIIRGDFNGHVGNNAQEDDLHGNNGYGMRNASGENIIQFANAMEMTISNMRFKKRSSQLITYESGKNKTQVDYILVAAKQAGNIIKCKVIPSEYTATQHKLVVMDLRLGIKEKSHPKVAIPKTKWWKFKETSIREQYHHLVNPELVYVRTWNELEEQIRKAGEKACGVTKQGAFRHQQAWWWHEEARAMLKAKKQSYKKWRQTQSCEDEKNYRLAKEAKHCVASKKAEAMKGLYDKLETPEGEKAIFRLARSQDQRTKDNIEGFFMRDGDGPILTEPHINWETSEATFMDINSFTTTEVKQQMKRMKFGKATGQINYPLKHFKV